MGYKLSAFSCQEPCFNSVAVHPQMELRATTFLSSSEIKVNELTESTDGCLRVPF